ncbi:unnamed protein product [Rhizophagus irregularis]|nr:unnamed protein product [Rhizophagus irregularis]
MLEKIVQGLISFQKFEAHEFIDAFAIDHCVGLFQIKTTYYVLDKDIDYTDENNRMGYIHTISENIICRVYDISKVQDAHLKGLDR